MIGMFYTHSTERGLPTYARVATSDVVNSYLTEWVAPFIPSRARALALELDTALMPLLHEWNSLYLETSFNDHVAVRVAGGASVFDRDPLTGEISSMLFPPHIKQGDVRSRDNDEWLGLLEKIFEHACECGLPTEGDVN